MHSKLIDIIDYNIILWGLLIGIVAYDLISEKLGFSYIDEIFVLVLFLYCVIRNDYSMELLGFIIISLFYLIYSYGLSITSVPAILTDFFIQIKPYLAFFCAYNLRLKVSQEFKGIICFVCICLSIFFIPIGLLGEDFLISMGSHPSRFCSAISIVGILYLYCSQNDKYDVLIATVIWTIGLLALKGKFIGFYVIAIFLFLIYPQKYIKFSFKNTFFFIVVISIVVFLTWSKIVFYFIEGSAAENSYARPVLYLNMINVLDDYPIFGSGFGTYATYASSIYYSPLYYKYGLHLNYEIGNGRFITDTFYPSLAQFGYIGIFLFVYFWYLIYKKGRDKTSFKMVLLIMSYFFIESIADATFTQNRGIYMLVLLAMFLNKDELEDKIIIYRLP